MENPFTTMPPNTVPLYVIEGVARDLDRIEDVTGVRLLFGAGGVISCGPPVDIRLAAFLQGGGNWWLPQIQKTSLSETISRSLLWRSVAVKSKHWQVAALLSLEPIRLFAEADLSALGGVLSDKLTEAAVEVLDSYNPLRLGALKSILIREVERLENVEGVSNAE